MATFVDIATDALLAIGAVGIGEPIPSDTMQLALRVGNRMLDSWTTRRLFIYTIGIATYPLVPAQRVYTIGRGTSPVADFVADRPVGEGIGGGIINANILLTNSSPYTRFPLEIIDDADWAAIPVTDIPSSIPLKLYNDGAYPNSNLYLWPWPSSPYLLELFMPQQLSQFPDIFTDFVFPPGYEKAVVLNLAIDLYPYFPKSGGVDSVLVAMAREARVNVQSLNSVAPKLITDAPKTGHGHSTWNWRTGMNS